MNILLIASILEVYAAIKGSNSSVPDLEIALLESMTTEGLQLVYNDACTLAEGYFAREKQRLSVLERATMKEIEVIDTKNSQNEAVALTLNF